MSDPEPTVVDARQLSNLGVQISSSGSTVTIRTGAKVHGRAVFRVVMSDVAGSSGPDRRVEGRITLDILGVPDVPGVPVPSNKHLDSKVELDWRAPQSNGAPIDYYEVRDQFGDGQRCRTTSCDITGLDQRDDVPVQRARPQRRRLLRLERAVDRGRARRRRSTWSAGSVWWRRATGSSASRGGRAKTKGGGQVTYVVRWPGGQLRRHDQPSATIADLDNHQKYVFTVEPSNVFDLGEWPASPSRSSPSARR